MGATQGGREQGARLFFSAAQNDAHLGFEVYDLNTHAVTGQADAEHARRPSKGVKGEWRAFQLVTSQGKDSFTSENSMMLKLP